LEETGKREPLTPHTRGGNISSCLERFLGSIIQGRAALEKPGPPGPEKPIPDPDRPMKIEEALDSLDAALLYIDCRHRIQWMNKRAAEWFGTGTGRRRACYRVASRGAEFCAICPTGRAIECGTPAHYEFTLEGGGKPRELEVVAVPARGLGGAPGSVFEIIMDVTGRGLIRIRQEELMEKVEKMAAIGRLAAGIAHELNTPLGTISIISDEIARMVEKGGPVPARELLSEHLSDMKGEIERCRGIINDLLGFSQAGATRLVPIDINPLVQRALKFASRGRGPGSVELSTDLAPGAPRACTDPDRFRQVLFNVVRNAIDAVEEKGGGKVSVSTSSSDEGFVRVSVTDDGPGIPGELLKRVFEPFFTTKPVGKGTGLGLSVSYGIMRDLKGEIQIDSRPGSTRVDLFLPQAAGGTGKGGG
jgi:signal transduction histidine kinase